MDLFEQIKRNGLHVNGIIHIGANNGQERYEYHENKVPFVAWVEPIDSVFEILKSHIVDLPGQEAIQAVCTEEAGQLIEFNISSNNGESSSILPLGQHKKIFPTIDYLSVQHMTSTTVDKIVEEISQRARANILVVDTQGADLRVLQGARKSLAELVDAVCVEVSEDPLYEGGCTMEEIVDFLRGFGFLHRGLSIHGLGHGDAFFCKKEGQRSYEVAPDISIAEALGLLTPYDVNLTKERIGPRKDGAYVYLKELLNNQTIFSYGIDGEYTFDIEMANRGHRMLMFDHTIDGIRNSDNNPRLNFYKEGVGGCRDASMPVDTISSHIAKYAPDETEFILKMDIEGCEYDVLMNLPVEDLCKFQQLCFEIHDLHHLNREVFRRKFVKTLTKINSIFTLFHVHANNFDGENTYTQLDGIPISNLLELSYVRSDLVERRQSATLYPTKIDYPNRHPKDKKLWFYPFLPTTVSQEEFSEAAKRIQGVADNFS